MGIEILSRLVAVLAAVAFTTLITRGRLPIVPPGRWTVAALFAVGLGMCTLAGIRDGIGTVLSPPEWLTGVFAALGIAALATLAAVLLGMSWRAGAVVLGLAIGANWFLALGYGYVAGLDTVMSGVLTLIVAGAASLVVWRVTLSWQRPTASAAS